MVVDKFVVVKWNPKTKKYFEGLGYVYTKMGDGFTIKIKELQDSSNEMIKIECDYCHDIYTVKWASRTSNLKRSVLGNDSCKKCHPNKLKDSIVKKYGVENIMDIFGVDKKRIKTLLDKYGVDNVFKSEKIKSKIFKTNIEKYGKKSFTQTKSYIKKSQKTSMDRYGELHYTKTKKYKDSVSGKNSPFWKGGKKDERWDRLSPTYKAWRDSVFQRDNYICKKCNKKKKYVEAHHIFNYKDFPDSRYDIDNGITFCTDCHISFHRIYGKKNNNKQQLNEFLK